MTRTSKQEERRARNPHKRKAPAPKTGPKQDNIPGGFKQHDNALADAGVSKQMFVGKVKGL